METTITLNEQNKSNLESLFAEIYQTSSNEEQLNRFVHMINTDLSDKLAASLIYHYGLDGGEVKSLDVTAKEFGMGRERMRQHLSKSIIILRGPIIRKYIFQ